VDVPGVLATTAAELGAALGARRARIEIQLPAPEAQAATGNDNGATGAAPANGANGHHLEAPE
jgi:hypothetical protein